MATAANRLRSSTTAAGTSASRPATSGKPGGRVPVLRPWLRAQSLNILRHAAALRPFRREEFGTGAAAPTEGHVQAVNRLVGTLRRGLLGMAARVEKAVGQVGQGANAPRLQQVVRLKHQAHDW